MRKMTPDERDLAAEHYDLALKIANSGLVRFADDPGLPRSIAGEALCEAAMSWHSKPRAPGADNFESFATKVIHRRLIDALRSREGRCSTSRKRNTQWVSIDAETPSGEGSWHEIHGGVDPAYAAVEADVLWFQVSRDLSDREATIVDLTLAGLSNVDIADHLEITGSRVGQIRKSVRERSTLADLRAS